MDRIVFLHLTHLRIEGARQFFDSVDDVVDAAQDLDTKGYDVYFALASFKEAKSRKVDNVQHLKSFFLDLDCGPSKDFVSQTEALAQLKSVL